MGARNTTKSRDTLLGRNAPHRRRRPLGCLFEPLQAAVRAPFLKASCASTFAFAGIVPALRSFMPILKKFPCAFMAPFEPGQLFNRRHGFLDGGRRMGPEIVLQCLPMIVQRTARPVELHG